MALSFISAILVESIIGNIFDKLFINSDQCTDVV